MPPPCATYAAASVSADANAQDAGVAQHNDTDIFIATPQAPVTSTHVVDIATTQEDDCNPNAREALRARPARRRLLLLTATDDCGLSLTTSATQAASLPLTLLVGDTTTGALPFMVRDVMRTCAVGTPAWAPRAFRTRYATQLSAARTSADVTPPTTTDIAIVDCTLNEPKDGEAGSEGVHEPDAGRAPMMPPDDKALEKSAARTQAATSMKNTAIDRPMPRRQSHAARASVTCKANTSRDCKNRPDLSLPPLRSAECVRF